MKKKVEKKKLFIMRGKQLDDLIAKPYQELELTETDEDLANAEDTLEYLRNHRELTYNKLREKGKGKASTRPRPSGLSSGVSSATTRYMESFQVSRMHNDILFLKEKAARLEAIISTGERELTTRNCNLLHRMWIQIAFQHHHQE